MFLLYCQSFASECSKAIKKSLSQKPARIGMITILFKKKIKQIFAYLIAYYFIFLNPKKNITQHLAIWPKVSETNLFFYGLSKHVMLYLCIHVMCP